MIITYSIVPEHCKYLHNVMLIPGALTVCETCNGCFHVSCHNRPLVQQPRQCPKCLGKRDNGSRDVGSLSVPPSMTVLTTFVSAEVKG